MHPKLSDPPPSKFYIALIPFACLLSLSLSQFDLTFFLAAWRNVEYRASERESPFKSPLAPKRGEEGEEDKGIGRVGCYYGSSLGSHYCRGRRKGRN